MRIDIPPADTGASTWSDGCPEGHVTTHRRPQKGGYYCNTCSQHYEGEPVPRGGVA